MLSGSTLTYKQERSATQNNKTFQNYGCRLDTSTNAKSTEIWEQSFLPCASHKLHRTKGQSRKPGSAFPQIWWQCQHLYSRYLHSWHRWLSPEADFRSAHASRGCSAVCEATRTGSGWAGQAKAQFGVNTTPSYHSPKPEIPHWLLITCFCSATVLHTSAVSGRKRCEK